MEIVGGTYGGLAMVASLAMGLLASFASYAEFKYGIGTPLCRPGSKVDCLRVHSMPQAWIFGFHLAQLAPPYFVVLLSLALSGLLLNAQAPLKILSFITVECSLLVPYLIYLMIREARAVCLYCLTMHASIVIVAALTHRIFLSSLLG